MNHNKGKDKNVKKNIANARFLFDISQFLFIFSLKGADKL